MWSKGLGMPRFAAVAWKARKKYDYPFEKQGRGSLTDTH
jgi:hypothetical protein